MHMWGARRGVLSGREHQPPSELVLFVVVTGRACRTRCFLASRAHSQLTSRDTFPRRAGWPALLEHVATSAPPSRVPSVRVRCAFEGDSWQSRRGGDSRVSPVSACSRAPGGRAGITPPSPCLEGAELGVHTGHHPTRLAAASIGSRASANRSFSLKRTI
jgi:hypothetical protein